LTARRFNRAPKAAAEQAMTVRNAEKAAKYTWLSILFLAFAIIMLKNVVHLMA
jgi:hypothetical protein